MSLQTDSVFIDAIKADAALMDEIGGRLYSTAVPVPDEDLDNVPLPYVVVIFRSMTNDAQTKDGYEGVYDVVTIEVLCVASTPNALHALTQHVREAIVGYMKGNETEVLDYQLGGGDIAYDQYKPCFRQTLTYQCDTDAEPIKDSES